MRAATSFSNDQRHHSSSPHGLTRHLSHGASPCARAGPRTRRATSPPRPCAAATTRQQLLSTDVKRRQQSPSLPRPQRQRGGGSGPGGDPSGPGPGRQPEGGPGGPGSGSGLPFRLRYWILLLTEYGGIYGTAAVVIGALAHVDALGGLHWDAGHVGLGLGLMAPVLLFDALVGLPDWSTRGEDARKLLTLFVPPGLLAASKEERAELREAREAQAGRRGGDAAGAVRGGEAGGAAACSAAEQEAGVGGSSAGTAAAASEERPAAGEASLAGSGGVAEASGGTAEARGSEAASTSGGGGPASGALWAAGQRLRMAMELMQESSVRNNPGARLTPLQEAAVIVAGVTAEEMLYRAVLLTLFGHWLRDRAYEAGFEETLLLGLPGSGLRVAVDTDVAASWVALGVGLALGAAVFAAKAWQETTLAKRLRAVQAAQRDELAKEIRKQRLTGGRTLEELQREADTLSRLEAAQAQLAASIGVQGALVWALEGSREVAQVAAAGSSFLLTGNLAAPLAGGLAAQVLVSAYQRLGLRRSMQRRAEFVAKRRAALQKGKEEAAAAEAAKAAEAAPQPLEEAGSGGGAAGAEQEAKAEADAPRDGGADEHRQ